MLLESGMRFRLRLGASAEGGVLVVPLCGSVCCEGPLIDELSLNAGQQTARQQIIPSAAAIEHGSVLI